LYILIYNYYNYKLMDKIHKGWHTFFDNNTNELKNILNNIDFDNEIIYPNKKDIFRAFNYFPPEEIRLLIIGQDPYISYEIINNIKVPQACGLAFSIPKSHKKIPPSLKNIFIEIKNNYPDFEIPKHGCLESWVKKEKILLLNSTLTVIEGKSNSHSNLWIKFTDNIIKYISDKNPSCVVLLMGNYAIKKESLIDKNKHKIFKTVHPSPLSAHRGFFGCGVFKEINNYLIENNSEPFTFN